MMEAYSDCEGALFWREAPICKQLQIFPEGQICLIVNGSIAGCALLLIVDCTNLSDSHTYGKITVNHTLSTLDPNRDGLFGIDVFVQPMHYGMCVWIRLYNA